MSTPVTPPPRPPLRVMLFTLGGCAVAIGLLATLDGSLATTLLLGSFGATCALVFGYPDVPFSQPRHVVLGHLFCVLVGLAAFHFLGSAPWVLALAVGTAAAGMMALRIMHPPATSNPIIVFLGKAAWGFALFPTLAGAILIVLVALAWNNGVRRTRYPSYWYEFSLRARARQPP